MLLKESIQELLYLINFFDFFESESQKALFFINLLNFFDISKVWGKGMATKKIFSTLV